MAKLTTKPTDINSEANAFDFVMRQFLSQHVFITLGLVIKSSGKTVDVKPMVHNMTGAGRKIENGIIYTVPVFSFQRSNSAVIMNPVVGDIGLIAICDRDISSVRATKAPALPGSKRTHNYSDAIYLGGVLNAEPQQYVEFVDNQINIVSPNKINVVAPTTEITSSNSITMNSPSIILNGAVIQGGGGNGGNATFGSTVTAKGEITGNGIKLSSHVHGGVESGGSKTNSPE
ncbi:Gp138 family membrane-puncturing spike protein [Photorhabdus laumondii]|uniref:Gp138 family membrane-puncturing spike protein n=1 Tax=Photorhabdus laumondii TaxID=2218628 RepID=UPI0025AF6323|nr:Gp138 family membrane-puncturing spike protein [Photorhabdus laumondii]